MLPSAIQIQSSSVSGGSFKPSAFTFSTQKLVSKLLFKNSISARPGASFFQSSTLPELKSNLRARKFNNFESSVVAVEPETGAEDSISSSQPKNESPTRSELKLNGRARKINHYDSSVAAVPVEPEAAAAEGSTSSCQAENKKPGKAVQLMQKPRLVLKFIWMEKNLGLTLDYLIPGHGTVPLSRYYFWPRKDAWEELKELIESKPWISQRQMVIILNHATDIINLWQLRCGD